MTFHKGKHLMRELTIKHSNAIIEVINATQAMVVTGNDLYGEASRAISIECDIETQRATQQFATDVAWDVWEIAEIRLRLQKLHIRATTRAEIENIKVADKQLVEVLEKATSANKMLTSDEIAERKLYP